MQSAVPSLSAWLAWPDATSSRREISSHIHLELKTRSSASGRLLEVISSRASFVSRLYVLTFGMHEKETMVL